MSPSCEELLALIPAYAIGATDADETRRIEAGLSTCPELAAELAAFRALDGALAASLPQVAPPPSVLTALLETTRRTRRPGRTLRRLAFAAAAAALLIVAIGGGLYGYGRIRELEQRLIIAERAQILRLPTAASGAATGARGQVIWLPEADAGLLLAEDFPPQPEGTVYQAWVTRDGVITSLGTFVVSADGSAGLTFPTALLAEPFDAIGVTLEPGSGSAQPTSAPVVRWQRTV
ncbi:MAG: anti-sigma factor domain-containing protein [Candidatus Flexifilum sp.]|jgi:anti-sigma-K factor RskA